MTSRVNYKSFAINADGTTVSSTQVEVRRSVDNSLETLYAGETGSTEAYSGSNPFNSGDGDPDA